MAKLLASEACWHAAEAAMQTHGGFALRAEYDIERKWREVRLYQIAPISTNLVLAYLGQHVLGMPRSSGAHPERAGHAEGAGGHADRQDVPHQGQGRADGQGGLTATCSSRPQVEVPGTLSKQQKELLRQLQETEQESPRKPLGVA